MKRIFYILRKIPRKLIAIPRKMIKKIMSWEKRHLAAVQVHPMKHKLIIMQQQIRKCIYLGNNHLLHNHTHRSKENKIQTKQKDDRKKHSEERRNEKKDRLWIVGRKRCSETTDRHVTKRKRDKERCGYGIVERRTRKNEKAKKKKAGRNEEKRTMVEWVNNGTWEKSGPTTSKGKPKDQSVEVKGKTAG